MDKQFENYASPEKAATKKAFTVTGNGVRISVLSPYLIRVEEQLSSVFCDQPTQAVICRCFDSPSFRVEKDSEKAIVRTEAITFEYSYRKRRVAGVRIGNGPLITDFSHGNLKGTRRTLDQTNGAVRLEDGILSRDGVAVLDDSKTLLIAPDGRIVPRKAKGQVFLCVRSQIYGSGP